MLSPVLSIMPRSGRFLTYLSCPEFSSHLWRAPAWSACAAEGTEFSLVRYLAAAGLGGGCSLYASVESDVLAGNLVLIDLDGPPLYLDVRLLMNPQRRLAKPVCDFTDFLRETFAAAD